MTLSSFPCPGTVHFGFGVSALLPEVVDSDYFLFTGSDPGRYASVCQGLTGRAVGGFGVTGEPDVDVAVRAARSLRESGANTVVAIGGGSVIDAAKAAAALAVDPGDPLDYLEVVGKGRPLISDPLPVVAVPTTFGTGSEVTRNAVLGAQSHGRKVSMRDARMVPRQALVDPALACSLPHGVAAASATDALVHVCEAYVCARPCKVMDPLCEDAVTRGFASIADFCSKPEGEQAVDMARVSLIGGMMIANAKLGAVHGFAGVIGGMAQAAHGNICAALFAPVFAANVKAVTDAGDKKKLSRYASLARCAMGVAEPEGLPEAISSLVGSIGLPTLGELGVREVDHEKIAKMALGSSSMQGNPVKLGIASLCEILERAS